MLGFNHKSSFTECVSELIDQALSVEHQAQPKREYLGVSRLGENCSRKLQYEYTNTRKDEGFSGQTLRIFAAGHMFEDLVIRWLRLAGLMLAPLPVFMDWIVSQSAIGYSWRKS